MLAKRFKTSLQSEGPPVLLTRNIVTGADKAEGVGDPSRLSQILHRFRPLHGQVWIEQFREVLLGGLLALLLCCELAPYPGELSGIKPEASAPRTLVHHYTAFDAVKVSHHDLRVSGAVDALAQVRMSVGSRSTSRNFSPPTRVPRPRGRARTSRTRSHRIPQHTRPPSHPRRSWWSWRWSTPDTR